MSQTVAGGRYRLLDLIGTGGTASVYRCVDTHTQEKCAVKVVNDRLASNPTTLKRFQREGRLLASLDHPNLLRVFDVGIERTAYMVMELITGGCVADWLDAHGAMPPRMASGVCIEVLTALSVAHAHGVVHRDVKPANILLTGRGQVKLSDFGIAQVSDTLHALTASNAMLGTWPYMAPEQRSDARSVDARTDVYAVAATLANLLSNKVPMHLYRADTHDELLAGVPDSLRAVITTGARYKQHDRFEDALAMRAAIEAALLELPPDPDGTPLGRGDQIRSLAPAPVGSSSTFAFELGGGVEVHPPAAADLARDDTLKLTAEARARAQQRSLAPAQGEPSPEPQRQPPSAVATSLLSSASLQRPAPKPSPAPATSLLRRGLWLLLSVVGVVLLGVLGLALLGLFYLALLGLS